jgi:hypothetical protein
MLDVKDEKMLKIFTKTSYTLPERNCQDNQRAIC